MKQKLINFFNQYKIYYTDKGSNVRTGNLNVQCPWCGIADKSEHLGIDPVKKQYACWRNASHRGRDLAKLIQALIHCTLTEARLLLGIDSVAIQAEGILSQVQALFSTKEIEEKVLGGVTKLESAKEFCWIVNSGARKRFYQYLVDRGFEDSFRLDELLVRNLLKCALTGDYAFRIIFPIYFQDQLVTWTSRSIYSNAYLRYKDLSIQESTKHIKYCLYDYDRLLKEGGKVLLVSEGPMDKLMLDYHFMNIDERQYKATCIFTLSMQDEQVFLLVELSKVFEEVVFVLDKGAETQMMALNRKLGFLKNVSFRFLPSGVKDPGEISERQLRRLL